MMEEPFFFSFVLLMNFSLLSCSGASFGAVDTAPSETRGEGVASTGISEVVVKESEGAGAEAEALEETGEGVEPGEDSEGAFVVVIVAGSEGVEGAEEDDTGVEEAGVSAVEVKEEGAEVSRF
ncbi:Midasin [Balamuthia mandrillaris]